MNRKKLAIILLSVAFVVVLADALFTNYLINQQSQWASLGLLPDKDSLPIEVNPWLTKIAGTPWLVVLKTGWVVLLLGIVLLIKDRKLKWPTLKST